MPPLSFLLAHLSDPHIGPLPRPAARELIGKRLTGYWNWHHSRHAIHNMDVLTTLMRDVAACTPDHIALSGDLVNLGMEAEFALAARLVLPLATPEAMSIVPGNHDAYVPRSLDHMARTFSPFMTGDDGHFGFPYLRQRGDVALIGLSSAIPTLPFLASGALGHAQMAAFEAMLAHARRHAVATVIMIHHPPFRGGSRLFRGLRDARALEAVLTRHGADLILHGHNHKRSLHHLTGPGGQRIPVVGVASASAVPGDPAHRAAYHLFDITPRKDGAEITLSVRGMETAAAPVTELDRLRIT